MWQTKTAVFYSLFQKGDSIFLHYVNNVKLYGPGVHIQFYKITSVQR